MGSPINFSYKDKCALLEKENKQLKQELELLKMQSRTLSEKGTDYSYSELFNGMTVPVRVYKLDGTVIAANEVNQGVFGIDLKNFIGKYNILEDSGEDNQESRQAFLRCRSEGRVVATAPQSAEANYENHGGKVVEDVRSMPVWIEKTFFPIFNSKNILINIGEGVMDITNRHHRRQESESYDEACRVMVENSRRGLVIAQKNSETGRTHIVYANKIAAQNVGMTLKELIGSSSTKMVEKIHPHDAQMVADETRKLLDGSASQVRYRMRVIKKGRVHWLEMYSTLIPNYRGRPAIQTASLDITDEVRAEEIHFHLVNDSLQGLAIIQDETYVFVNPAMENITGYTREELLSFKSNVIDKVIYKEDRDLVRGRYLRRIRGEEVINNYDLRIVRKDGEVRWVNTFSVRMDYSGRSAVHAVYIDITERKRLEEELSVINQNLQKLVEERTAELGESRALFKAIADTVPAIVYLYNVQTGEMQYVNDSSERVLGYSMEDYEKMGGAVVASVTHEDDQDHVQAKLKQLQDPKTTGYLEGVYRMKTKDDLWKYFLMNDTIFKRDEEGKPLLALGTAFDVTDLEEAKLEVETRFEILKRVGDSIPGIVDVYDLVKRRLVYVNNKLPELLGYEVSETQEMGEKMYEILAHPDDLQKIYDNIAKIPKMKLGETDSFIYRIRHKNGQWKWFQTTYGVFAKNSKQNILQSFSVAMDITNLKEAELRAEENSMLLDTFFQHSPVLLFMHDLNQKYLKASRSAVGLMGVESVEFRDVSAKGVFGPEIAKIWEQENEKILQTGEGLVSIQKFNHQDKEYVGETHKFPIYNSQGEIYAIGGVSVDKTSLKRAEAEAEKNFQLLDAFFQNSPIPFFIIDADQKYIKASDSLGEYIQQDARGIVGRPVREVFGEEIANKWKQEDDWVMQHKETLTVRQQVELGGDQVWGEEHKFPIVDFKGEVFAVGGIFWVNNSELGGDKKSKKKSK